MNIDIIKKADVEYEKLKATFEKAYEYYKGNTDAIKNYKLVTDRNNNKVNTNFLKKFVKEEVSYSVGNDITYISNNGNDDFIRDINYNLSSWNDDHDSKLAKIMILYSRAYELYYQNKNLELCSRIIDPRHGFIVKSHNDEVIYFIHKYEIDDKTYINVYDEDKIYFLDESFNTLKPPKTHIFGVVPVGVANLSDEGIDDTIYKDIKGLQDAYETNLSDISNEISDFRNAYLVLTGCEVDEDKAKEMKKNGILQIPTSDGKAAWLIKNINDTFIQNTLSTLEDKMYQITAHINHNEKIQSNTSSLALRSKLISLEEKCKLNQKSLSNCIKFRINIICKYLKEMENKNYDYRDIKIKFTPNIPQDDLMIAQIIAQLGDKLSTETALSLLSFIENPSLEVQKLKKELEMQVEGEELLNGDENE